MSDMAKMASGFSAEVTRKLAQVTYRQLVYWDTTGLIRPSIEKAKGRGSRRVYSFEDLVELRVIQRLLATGVTLKAVRKAAHYVRKHFASVTRPLARLALVVQGKSILVRTLQGKELIDATADGQVVINFAVGPIAEAVRGEVKNLSAPREIPVRVRGATYSAVLAPDLVAGGYSITVQDLPGVFTEAETVTEARAMVREVVGLWLDEAESKRSRKAR
jgi:DNA-binding transcriptional MerR regulator/predicted RNase H-like HicB family nuclease